jgi:anthranilate phosphoribosyltransferase
MEQLGYKFKNDKDRLKKEVDEANICFLHAPMFHPALKTVGPIRKNLGMRTFFNILGPMVNPASPKFQLIGVFSLEMARIYNYLLQQSDTAFTIIHSLDGYDEISLTNDTKVITNEGEKIMTPEQLGKRMVSPQDISGGNSVEEAAKIFAGILKGEGSWAQNAVVLANAAMALQSTGNYKNYDEAYSAAVESLESGKANEALKKLIALNN